MSAPVVPSVPLLSLDTLWLQVAGTLCNIECTHCFISCSPRNRSHEMMAMEQIERLLDEAASLGVREYYLTGGEPFMHRQILPILERILRQGPVTVLTNGMLLRPETCAALRALSEASRYSLDLRISLDGWNRESHDAVRGAGVWDRVMTGLRNLGAAGLDPVITVTEAAEGVGTAEGRERFLALIRSFGLRRARLKILPLFRLGAEESRSRSYEPWERLTGAELTRSEAATLQCSSCRMATSRGVFVCPILIESPDARLGDSLADSLHSFPLAHGACYTCWVEGASCRT